MPKNRPYRRKLIEVLLPLNSIDKESEKDSGLKTGHPRMLHKWWARRPLAACRAVIFASLVDDPIDCPEEFPTAGEQNRERARLHELISRLVNWDNVDQRTAEGADLIREARYEVARSLARSRGDTPPTDPDAVLEYLTAEGSGLTVYDPFCGGGSIPLESQRLGLNAVGSDLNPISVMITKSTVELPTRFVNTPPVNPEPSLRSTNGRKAARSESNDWVGYSGLASDVRHYGRRTLQEVLTRVGHLYPKATLDRENDATVVAWLWANTVPCPNPVCRIAMPLIRNFRVSNPKRPPRYVQPFTNYETHTIEFSITESIPETAINRTISSKGAVCLACETPAPLQYVRDQSAAGNMRSELFAIAIEQNRSVEFIPPNKYHAQVAGGAVPPRRPLGSLPPKALSIRTRRYGLTEWHHMFTQRQLTLLCTFSDVLSDIVTEIRSDGGSTEYADLVKTYLAFAVGRLAHVNSRLCRWDRGSVAGVFANQGLGMVWDFAESNPFSNRGSNWVSQVNSVATFIDRLPTQVSRGHAFQADAASSNYIANGPVIVTDPPYYDNIGYADISDFFYIWHNDMLRETYPDLFLGSQTPKKDEIVVGPLFQNPQARFEKLMAEVLFRIESSCSKDYPSSIFYAYLQKEIKKGDISSTGWETFLAAIHKAGLRIVGTWPVRTELGSSLNAIKGNTLASSVVIVTRPRDNEAKIATRQQFIAELESTLPADLDRLTRQDNIAPIDLAQSAIGPGMKIYTKYSSVETIAGDPVPVRDALVEINRVIGNYFLMEQGELDADTQFCIDWLKEHGFGEGPFGVAEVLAKAKDIAIGTLVSQGLLEAKRGRVRLLPIEAFKTPENVVEDIGPDTTSWEGLMRVAFHFQFPEEGRRVEGAAEIIRGMGPKSDQVERLARIMFNHYDRKSQPRNSRVYNHIADAWRDIREQAGYGRQLSNVD